MAKANGFGTGLAGIITGGTALASQLGLFGGCGNGGGLFGNNRNCEPMESKEAAELRSKLAASDAANLARAAGEQSFKDSVTYASTNIDKLSLVVGKLADEAVTTRVALAEVNGKAACLEKQVEKLSGTVEKLAAESADQRVREAELNGRITCLTTTTAQRFEAQGREFNQALACLAGETRQGLAAEREFVTARYVPGTLYINPADICGKSGCGSSTASASSKKEAA